jgi:hypothetical protein
MLPLLLVRRQPIRRDVAVNVLVTEGSALKPGSQYFQASVRDVMLNGLINKPASFARLDDPVDGANRGLWQNDIKTFAHGKSR